TRHKRDAVADDPPFGAARPLAATRRRQHKLRHQTALPAALPLLVPQHRLARGAKTLDRHRIAQPQVRIGAQKRRSTRVKRPLLLLRRAEALIKIKYTRLL